MASGEAVMGSCTQTSIKASTCERYPCPYKHTNTYAHTSKHVCGYHLFLSSWVFSLFLSISLSLSLFLCDAPMQPSAYPPADTTTNLRTRQKNIETYRVDTRRCKPRKKEPASPKVQHRGGTTKSKPTCADENRDGDGVGYLNSYMNSLNPLSPTRRQTPTTIRNLSPSRTPAGLVREIFVRSHWRQLGHLD